MGGGFRRSLRAVVDRQIMVRSLGDLFSLLLTGFAFCLYARGWNEVIEGRHRSFLGFLVFLVVFCTYATIVWYVSAYRYKFTLKR